MSTDPSAVIAGNERVIRPRLTDAAFFFEQDTKSSLMDKIDRLSSVIFQTELGTYGDKTARTAKLAGHIARQIGAEARTAERAATLCKADLVSDMVGEFPDLQGVMGGYYAKHDGESDEVIKGIQQHYRPTQAGGILPEGPIASAVSLADKIDTMTGLFGINQPPTGSRDPFALRRQSLGVIRICIENNLDLTLADCFSAAAEGYDRGFDTSEVLAYIVERLTGYYSDQGIARDIVEAATAAGTGDVNLAAIDRAIRSIRDFRQTPLADQIIAANKRVANLLKKVDTASLPAFNPDLATAAAEQQLSRTLDGISLKDSQSVDEKLTLLAALQSPVDQFFEEVLVMDENPEIQNNRLALLARLRNQFLQVADFSLLQ